MKNIWCALSHPKPVKNKSWTQTWLNILSVHGLRKFYEVAKELENRAKKLNYNFSMNFHLGSEINRHFSSHFCIELAWDERHSLRQFDVVNNEAETISLKIQSAYQLHIKCGPRKKGNRRGNYSFLTLINYLCYVENFSDVAIVIKWQNMRS